MSHLGFYHMKIYDAKNIKYRDKLVEKRRRIWILKILFFTGLVIAMIGFILYLLFFSGLLGIKEVSISGLDKVNSDKFNDAFNKRLNSKWLGLFEYQRNMLFFNSDAFKAEVFALFPEVKDISINKKLPHSLDVGVVERGIAGIWCFIDNGSALLTTSCKYFDEKGILWGEATRSSGFLILTVEDLRQETNEMIRQGSTQADYEFLENIMLISERLKKKGILINKFTVPDDFIGDFSALTSRGYELRFGVDSDIEKQLEVLEIFLAEKQDEIDFQPQYIDLRTSGRVYYK